MPDLMVYDEEKHETSFVEVKFRKTDSPERVKLTSKELRSYRQYWNDSILVVVIPVEHNFYAQKVSQVDVDEHAHQYNLAKEFKFIEGEFAKVTRDNITRYKLVLQEFKAVLGEEKDEEESP